jgi:hypothetical protein
VPTRSSTWRRPTANTSAAEALLDLLVEVASAQTPEHRVMLGIHHFADAPREVRGFEVIGVASLLGREDRSTVIEVGDDVRMRAPTVLGLDVEEHATVTNVRIEAREHPGFRPPHKTEEDRRQSRARHRMPVARVAERAFSLRDPQRACNDSCLSARSRIGLSRSGWRSGTRTLRTPERRGRRSQGG